MNISTTSIGIFLVLLTAGSVFAQTATTMNITAISPAAAANFASAAKLTVAADLALDAGNYALAESDARHSIALAQDTGRAHRDLAAALAAEGKIKEALGVYSATVCPSGTTQGSTDPRDVLPYALLLLKDGQWSKAVATYYKSLPFDGLPDRVWEIGCLLRQDSAYNYDDPDPNGLEADIRIALGLSNVELYENDHIVRDLSEYKQALGLEPDSPLAQLAYADGLRHAGRLGEADDLDTKVAAETTGNYRTAALFALNDQATVKSAIKIEAAESR